MGKTHEALKRAEKESGLLYPEKLHPHYEIPVSVEPGRLQISALSGPFEEVRAKLVEGFPLGRIKTILFTGTAHGDGCTTLATIFARTIAQTCGLNVLLVDANLRTPSLHRLFNLKYNKGLTDLLTGTEKDISPFRNLDNENLCLITCGSKNLRFLTIFESVRFDNALTQMREKFDYVIIDSAPAIGYAETKVIARKADGVILVIKAGQTRRLVALRAKKDMEDAGAKFLGAIVNRRRYYIPGWIYRRI